MNKIEEFNDQSEIIRIDKKLSKEKISEPEPMGVFTNEKAGVGEL